MERRTVVSSTLGIVSALGLAGCSSGGIGNNTPDKFRLESETITTSEICENTIQDLDELHSRDQEPVQEAIATGDSVSESSGRQSLYIRHSGEFFFIDISPRDSDNKEMYSVRSERDTYDEMCELVKSNLVTYINRNQIDNDIETIIDEAVETGTYESSPITDSAEKALNFFAEIDGGRGIYPIYIGLEGAYYVFEFYYRSGE